MWTDGRIARSSPALLTLVFSLLLIFSAFAARSAPLYHVCLYHYGGGSAVCEPEEAQISPPLVVGGGPVSMAAGQYWYQAALSNGEMKLLHDEEVWGPYDLRWRILQGAMEFDDVVFTDGTTDTGHVDVTLNLHLYGSYTAGRATGSGEFCLARLEVILLQGLMGKWYPASNDVEDPSTGMFAGIDADFLDGIYETPVFSVRKNTPVRFRVNVHAWVKAGVDPAQPGARARSTMDFQEGDSRIGFPATGPVFGLPGGMTVHSAQAGIVDNQWTGNLATSVVPQREPVLALWLGAATPNPFSAETRLEFSLAREGRARVTIHDVAGRCIATLVNGTLPAGGHSLSWDGTAADGHPVATGVYFCRLNAAGSELTRKLTLVR